MTIYTVLSSRPEQHDNAAQRRDLSRHPEQDVRVFEIPPRAALGRDDSPGLQVGRGRAEVLKHQE